MKKVILNEEQMAHIISMEKEPCACVVIKKHYTIDPDKVMLVKRFLDGGFKRGTAEEVGADGFPHVRPVVAMLSSGGEELKNLEFDELKDLLVDKFKKMFLDTDEREKFLGQVMKDWYNNKIGLYGSLSVNHL